MPSKIHRLRRLILPPLQVAPAVESAAARVEGAAGLAQRGAPVSHDGGGGLAVARGAARAVAEGALLLVVLIGQADRPDGLARVRDERSSAAIVGVWCVVFGV